MEIVDYLIKSMVVGAIIVIGASWLIYFSIKTLSKHTDFGKLTKKEKEKEDKIHGSEDDVPLGEGPFQSFHEVPKIETSFGDKRLGDVHEEP